jgi:hypothetical protein
MGSDHENQQISLLFSLPANIKTPDADEVTAVAKPGTNLEPAARSSPFVITSPFGGFSESDTRSRERLRELIFRSSVRAQ